MSRRRPLFAMLDLAPDDKLDSSNLHFADVGGVRTRYYEDGRGEPLLLLHGGEFGSLYSLDCWSLNLTALAKRSRVVAVDRLGQGFTDNPSSSAGYTYAAVLGHVVSFVEQVVREPVHVAGHSRGGLVAASLALARPELVKRVMIVSSATLAENPDQSTASFYDAIARPGARLPQGQLPTEEDVRVEPDAQAFNRQQVTVSFVRRMLEIARRPETAQAGAVMETLGEAWHRDIDAERRRASHMLTSRGLGVPTQVFWGRDDRSAQVDLAYSLFSRVARTTADARLVIVNQAGHYCFRDQPRAFEQAITTFCLGD